MISRKDAEGKSENDSLRQGGTERLHICALLADQIPNEFDPSIEDAVFIAVVNGPRIALALHHVFHSSPSFLRASTN